MKSKQLLTVLWVFLAGAGLTTLVWKKVRPAAVSEHDQHHDHDHGDHHDQHEAAFQRGPRGGRLLEDGPFAVEITIFETGVPPQFRVYAYESGKPLNPSAVSLNIELKRLGGRVDRHEFRPEADCLTSGQTVYEPHSFDVTVTAEHAGRAHRWEYASHEARVAIAPDMAGSSGIRVETAGPARIRTERELPGEVKLDAERTAQVPARFEGVVTEARKRLGDRVRQGEVLAVIESRALAEARGDFIEAVHRLELAQARFVREENLWRRRISAEQDYLGAKHELEEMEIRKQAARQKLLALGLTKEELAELAVEPEGKVVTFEVRKPFPEKSLTRYEIHAPMDGTVIERNVAAGQTVAADAGLFTVADLSEVWVEVALHLQDVAHVATGQRATVISEALERSAEGTVSYLSPVLAEPARTALARVVLPNTDGAWRPGLFVRVRLVREETQVPVAVKETALQTFRDWQVVFINEGNQYEPVVVETGRRGGGRVEIVSGLQPGQRYVAEGSFVVKADILKSGAVHEH